MQLILESDQGTFAGWYRDPFRQTERDDLPFCHYLSLSLKWYDLNRQMRVELFGEGAFDLITF